MNPSFAHLWQREISAVAGYELGYPSSSLYKGNFQGIRVRGQLPKPCHVRSKWLSYSRGYKKLAQGFEVTEESQNFLRFIEPDEFKTAEFQNFVFALKACAEEFVVIYQPVKNKEVL